MELSLAEKIRALSVKKGIPMYKIADALGCSRQNFIGRMNRNSWKEDDLKIIAEALNCSLDIAFVDKDTGERY